MSDPPAVLGGMSDPQQVLLGARIDFYRTVGPGPDHTVDAADYVASAVLEDGFAGASVPQRGDLVSPSSLTGGGRDARTDALQPSHGPFLPVALVEHYPVACDETGALPDWWSVGYTRPAANLVFRAIAPRDAGLTVPTLAAALTARGWAVDQALHDYAAGPAEESHRAR